MSAAVPQRPAGIRSRIWRERCRIVPQRLGVVGLDVARRDRVDVDAVRGPLVRERLRQLRDATLARCVPGDVDPALEGEERGDEDDLPRCRARASSRPISRVSTNCAVRFTSRTVVPVLVAVLGRRAAPDRAGVVDEHVDRRPGSQRLDEVVDRGPIAEVAACAHGRSSPRCAISLPTAPPSGSSVALTPITSAPASANAIEIASPMPRRQPVTSTVEPENEPAVTLDSRSGSSSQRRRRPVPRRRRAAGRAARPR